MPDNDGGQGPKSTFSTYMAEGEQLFHKGEYGKATESYSAALILKPDDKNCLVARSKCYVKLGESAKALKDADASLKEDGVFFKGLHQKAEALYTMGDFEFALVFYHRGHRLRPELQDFRLGIQKAQEAINNCVGSPSSVKLENKSTLSFVHKVEDLKMAQQKYLVHPLKKVQRKQDQEMPKNERTAKQLLSELYADKEYLEKLLKDEDLIKGKTRSGEHLQELIFTCISYLDTRTEFWRQQKPIYARQHDRQLQHRQWSHHHLPSDPTCNVLRNLEKINAALNAGNAESSLKKAREVLKNVQGWSEDVLPNRTEVLGHLYSCLGNTAMGNALMDLGDMDKALDNHLKDLELAKQGKLMDSKSRALDNIGRVYARTGKFQQAIEAWEEKVCLLRSGLEKAWLFHEIGRCYLELKQYVEARDYGTQSLGAASDICDEKWQLNASVLVAQAELKLGNFKTSVLLFEKALDLAKEDTAARDAIQKVLSETRQLAAL
ncbi:tetratricopeptide repeat protein 25 isoform X1 [Electrophorus electricus]|uniref:tetratricopeptide repeat protein 25 isoform X1 n=1 Tax=Electrophorus electricus TaxID=8005 RepID=UPI0015CFAEC4|nr:tetratricopeptide repeat protein 25 isoform X1 [Electrophorus electricus]